MSVFRRIVPRNNSTHAIWSIIESYVDIHNKKKEGGFLPVQLSLAFAGDRARSNEGFAQRWILKHDIPRSCTAEA